MSILEFQKQQLQYKIAAIEDEKLIQKIEDLLDKEAPYKLSDAQKAAIQRGLEDVKAGRVVSNEEAEKELDKWLEE